MFAKTMGISPSYLSDIENNRCLPPYRDKGSSFIEKASKELELTAEESERLYLLADQRLYDSFAIADDMKKYLTNAPKAQLALRKAVNREIDSKTWDEIIKIIVEGEKNE